MLDLSSHLLLTSNGWEHVSNLGSYSEAEDIQQQLELHGDAYEYQIGEPKSGAKYTVEVLTSMGFVGLYRRGGRPVVRDSLEVPSIPFFSDHPFDGTDDNEQGRRMIHDKPAEPMFAGVA